MTIDEYELRQREIQMICRSAINNGLALNAPFEIRQRVVKSVVDKITLNVNEGWFEMEGVIRGQYLLFDNDENKNENGPDNGPENKIEDIDNPDGIEAFKSNSKGMDSSQQPTENWH